MQQDVMPDADVRWKVVVSRSQDIGSGGRDTREGRLRILRIMKRSGKISRHVSGTPDMTG